MSLRIGGELSILKQTSALLPRRTCACSAVALARLLSTSTQRSTQVQIDAPPAPPPLPERHLAGTKREERRLLRAGIWPIGSRRRRSALKTAQYNIPFEQLPYQCFQEARKVLLEDRQEKLKQIEVQRGRIERLKGQPAAGEAEAFRKQNRLGSMERYLEKLKVLADINDPLVKKRFEDGFGDMNRPVYRHLEEQKWRSRRRVITMQRLTQMHVVPDVLPNVDLTADLKLSFGRREIPPGEFVPSKVSESVPKLSVQVYSRGERLITIAVVDPDVPNVETDSFQQRCHLLAVNIPISPTLTAVPSAALTEGPQLLLPWMAPFAQRGSPYHRLSVFALEQKDGEAVDAAQAKETVKREGFSLRGLANRHRLRPIAAHMFRTRWDEGMEEVMERHGYPGAQVELRRKKVEPLPYKRKNPERYR